MNVIAVKYRLYPTHTQETALQEALEVCRNVYNSFLHWRTFAYETEGKSVGRFEQEKVLSVWKKTHPELKRVHAHILQNVAVRVDLAFGAFYRRAASGETAGYPRKKSVGCYDSLTWKEYANGNLLNENTLSLSKIGDIQTVVHRPLPGVAKNCTVRRHAGKWFACFSCEVETEPLPESDEKIGIDVGLEKFAALSDGEFIENPRFLRKDEKALKKAQRKLDKLKHAKTREQKIQRSKARKVVARVHERIRSRRHDFVHQNARRLVNRYGLIAVEKLNVKNMSKSPQPKQDQETGLYLPNGHAAKAGLNKSICDAAWSMFRNVLTQKAESAGRLVVNVNPAYTSQDCSGCGYRPEKEHRKKLSDRWHFCPICGLSLDRDTNSAILILKTAVGLHSVAGAISIEAAGL